MNEVLPRRASFAGPALLYVCPTFCNTAAYETQGRSLEIERLAYPFPTCVVSSSCRVYLCGVDIQQEERQMGTTDTSQ